MNFLQPFILWGLPLVLLPVLIHLLNRMRYRTVPWAAMMFVLAAMKHSTRQARLREWLILLMRALAVLALVLANTRAGADSPESRVNRRNMLTLVDREGPSGVAREMMPKMLGKTTHDTNPSAEGTVRRLIKQQSPIAIRSAIHRMMHRPDSTALLPQISVPTLTSVPA